VFLDLSVLFHQPHAAVSGNAMTEVYDKIAFVQVQETIDRPAQPAVDARGTLHVGPAEKFAAAQKHDAIRNQAEAVLQGPDGKLQTAVAGELRAGKDLAQPADFGLGLADQKDLLAAAGVVELVADFLDVPAETLDRLDG
jgi:hypothetical protein